MNGWMSVCLLHKCVWGEEKGAWVRVEVGLTGFKGRDGGREGACAGGGVCEGQGEMGRGTCLGWGRMSPVHDVGWGVSVVSAREWGEQFLWYLHVTGVGTFCGTHA